MKFIKKFFIIIIAIICIGFFFIYRQYNINKLEKIRENQALFNSGSKNEIVCSTDYEPVCGVDNKEYGNKCIAEKINSVEIKNTGKCKNKELTDNDLPENIGEHNLGETEENSTGITSSGTDLNETIESDANENEEIKTNPEYYKNLKSQCGEDGCCLDSVDNMEKGDYSEAINDLCPTGYKVETLKCSTSYKWCTKDNSITTSNPTSGSGSKTLNYENSNFNYGFSLPKNTYFAGYGASSGANHTVGISTNSGVTTFDENDVKVYYYKGKILDELKNTKKYIDENNGKIYIELKGNSIVIESKSGNEKIINSIIDTIYQK